MARNYINIREGSIDFVQFQIISSGSAVSLSSIDHVEMNLRDLQGNITTFTSAGGSPKLFVTDATNGIVELRPASTDFYCIRSPYQFYLRIYETATRDYTIPENEEGIIYVRQSF